MARIASRQDLKDYCLRRLGFPVIDINVDDDQLEDRIDEGLQFFQKYHYESMEKAYISHHVTQQDVDNKYLDMTQLSGQANTVAGSNVVTGQGTTYYLSEIGAGATQIQIGNEVKNVISVANNSSFTVDSSFTTSNDWAPVTNLTQSHSIISVNKIFTITSTSATVNMFDLRYQLRLHELYDFTSTSYINYVLTQQHLRTLDMLFSGEAPLRFEKHRNKLYIDFKWGEDIQVGEYLVAEVWRIIDPDLCPDIYDDRWLKKYTTALFKRQWGSNLSKFAGIQLPGGVSLNGPQLYLEATNEINQLEQEIQSNYEVPPMFIIG